MKKILQFCLAFALIASTFSCSNNGSTDPGNNNIVSSGSWRVTLFTDSGNDETSDFNGFNFIFQDNGTVTAMRNGVTTTGSWNNTNSSRFVINLGPKIDSNKPLGELTDDWVIISISNTEIRLTDDNASSNEFVTFTKN